MLVPVLALSSLVTPSLTNIVTLLSGMALSWLLFLLSFLVFAEAVAEDVEGGGVLSTVIVVSGLLAFVPTIQTVHGHDFFLKIGCHKLYQFWKTDTKHLTRRCVQSFSHF